MKSQVASQESITVSIVDDEEAVRKPLAALIGGMRGYRVAGSYGSGQEALRRIPADRPGIVLMDLKMPQMSGLDCARKLQGLKLPMKLVFITAFPESEAVEWALRSGGASFLMKPFSRDELAEALKAAVEGAIYLSPAVKQICLGAKAGEETDARARLLSTLTPRERQALRLSAQGLSYKQIAEKLGVRYKRLDHILESVRAKLDVHTMMEAVNILRESEGGAAWNAFGK